MPAFALLNPSQVLQRNGPVPNVIHTNEEWNLSPAQQLQWSAMMGRDMFALMMYNKTQEDRICPGCRTRYRPLPEDEALTRQHKEQRLSSICSARCFEAVSGPGAMSVEEWMGESASGGVYDLQSMTAVVQPAHGGPATVMDMVTGQVLNPPEN